MMPGFWLLMILLPVAAGAQTAKSFEFRNGRTNPAGRLISAELFIRVGENDIKIANDAIEAWILDKGRAVIFSSGDTGGQSLTIYDVAAGKLRRIMSDTVDVDGLTEIGLSDGRRVLLVRLSDAESGEPFVAVVDPARGRLLRRRGAEPVSISKDRITIGYFRSDDWEKMFDERSNKGKYNKTAIADKTSVRAFKTETLDLKKVMKFKAVRISN